VKLRVMCRRDGEWSMAVLRVQGSSVSFSPRSFNYSFSAFHPFQVLN
jgi:hypothetical protein